MSRFIFIAAIFHFCWLSAFTQMLAPGKYWIQLTDKNNSPYSVHDPELFLSPEAINRRIRHNISITEEDFPVIREYTDSLSKIGFQILGSSRWFNAVIAVCYDSLLLNMIQDLDFVKDFTPHISYRIAGGVSNTITRPPHLKLNNFPFCKIDEDYGMGLSQLNILNGKALHDYGYRGSGIRIAMLDAGFYHVNQFDAFRHLWDDRRIIAVKDFVNPGDSDVFAESAHGMSSLSTIAAYVPGLFIGTAPEAEFLLLRTEDASSEYRIEEANWLMAAEYADSAGADIISTSLGYNVFNDSSMNYVYGDMDGKTALVTKAAEMAFSKGMIVISSAGNEGNKTWRKITAPSDGVNVLSVGAIDSLAFLAHFSSRGPASDGRIKPDVVAVGYETTIVNSSGIVSRGFGTSFAAPQMSGLAACLWQSAPEKSNIEIIQAIRRSAHKYAHPDNDMGYGIPNFMLAFHILSETLDLQKKIWIFPNPFTDNFNVYFDIPVSEIQIIDIYGRIMMVIETNIQAYEVKNVAPEVLKPGIYLIVGRNKNDYRISRVIKQ